MSFRYFEMHPYKFMLIWFFLLWIFLKGVNENWQYEEEKPSTASDTATITSNQASPNSKKTVGDIASVATTTQPQLVVPATSATIIGSIATIKSEQTQAIEQKPTIISTCDTGNNKTLQTANLQQISTTSHANLAQDIQTVQPQAHLSIANGSLVVVQDQPGGKCATSPGIILTFNKLFYV